MRDPISWSFPIGRLFGISVRVHFLFPVVMAGLILRAAFRSGVTPGTWIDAAMVMGLLFFTVFLHELGHCFTARWVGGEANEVLLWPLGGLAYVEVPHTPQANFLTAAGGPLVNVFICLGCALALGFVLDPALQPPWNPIWYPYREIADGSMFLIRWDGSSYPTNNLAALILVRLFWVSWITLLFNVLVIGFPLDGGRMFQCLLWPFVGYRQATLYAVFMGFFYMILVLVVAFVIEDPIMPLFLAWFLYTACKQEWILLETGGEESLFGYDFSQGYTSLEKEQPPPPKAKKPNFIQRWLQRRAARKLLRELERREAEERRMDELLEKITRSGKDSLTEEEKRFLKRVSDRYRNRS